jgi:hypothetical protein
MCILKVGQEPDNDIHSHGFISTDTITLLGMEVKRYLSNQDEIFQKIHEKILGIARFWDLFKLSLPGRISIVKTLMLSQLNYLGCISTPSTGLLSNIQKTVDNFA